MKKLLMMLIAFPALPFFLVLQILIAVFGIFGLPLWSWLWVMAKLRGERDVQTPWDVYKYGLLMPWEGWCEFVGWKP